MGLAEAAGLPATTLSLHPRAPWRWFGARVWPRPLSAVRLPPLGDTVLVSAGGTAAVVAAALRRPGRPVVQVQHPRIDPARVDVMPDRLAAAAAAWAPRLAHLPRPLVAVLVGGSNGRFRLDAPVAQALADGLAATMRADRVGLALTPSRRTAPEARAALAATLEPLGAWCWDMTGDNPYYGLLALADAIVVTEDSVSMVSEAAATAAPVLLAGLPGHSRRIRLFNRLLIEDGRVRRFAGRLDLWPVTPLNDTPAAGTEVRRRLGLPAPGG